MDTDDLRVFLRVAELQNLTRAGEQRGMTKSRVSRRIATLEEQLGARLFHRSTRSVRLTPDGEALLPYAHRLVRDADEVDALFRTGPRLRGQVRIDLPVSLGRSFILPTLPDLLARHPNLELFISTTDRIVDAVREGFDCVLRVGELEDSELTRRRLGELPMVNCVGRRYADRRGVPGCLEDLKEHTVIHYHVSARGLRAPAFEYEQDGETIELPMHCAVTVNNADAYTAACLAGLGIVQTPRIGMRERLLTGEVVEVLPEHSCAPMPVSLLSTHGRRPPRRVRAVLGWIADALIPALV